MTPLPTITTERLVLRPFLHDDADAVERLAGNREVADTTLRIPHPYPPGTATLWIETLAPAWEERTALTLAVAPRDERGTLLGAVGLSITREHARAELGYWIARHAWGRGYATEAARALIAYGFDELALYRIEARYFARNPASGRVLEKLGMQREGVFRSRYVRWGQFEDSVMCAILAPEWRAPPRNPPD